MSYAIATTDSGTRVVVGGADLKKLASINAWWSTRQVNSDGNPLCRLTAAAQLSPSGEPFTLSFGAKTMFVRPRAIFTSGSDDDSRIYFNMQRFHLL